MALETSNTQGWRTPWLFLPALYLATGAGGGGILGALSAVMLKDFGYSNTLVGFAALLALPDALRFLWAPQVDALAPKRVLSWRFTGAMAFALLVLAATVGSGILAPPILFAILLLFAFALSGQEIAADGYYIRIFDRSRQAKFVGVKAAAIRVGILVTIALFITGAGVLQQSHGLTKPHAWGLALAGAGLFLLVLAVAIRVLLPHAPGDEPVQSATAFPLRSVLAEYLAQPGVRAIILALLLFRFGEGLLASMLSPFYLDPASAGGYGLGLKDVGLLKTFTDVPWIVLGGLLGGFFIMRWGFRRTVFPLTLALTLPNFAYAGIAAARPEGTFSLFGHNFPAALFAVSSIESLGYGLGFSAFYYYIHALARGPHRTSLLAISGGILALSFALPGAIGGVLQARLGYPAFFTVAALLSLPTFLVLPHLPRVE